jgi:hypothetical protein
MKDKLDEYTLNLKYRRSTQFNREDIPFHDILLPIYGDGIHYSGINNLNTIPLPKQWTSKTDLGTVNLFIIKNKKRIAKK